MTALRGIAVAPGVGVGTAWVLHQRNSPARRSTVADRPAEVARLQDSIEASRREIERAARTLRDSGSEAALVLDAHVLLHGDVMLTAPAEAMIEEQGVNAEWAVDQVARRSMQILESSSSAYFRERAQDILHVSQHIVRHLRGHAAAMPSGDEPVVLIADDLSPADAVRILGADSIVTGVALQTGSATSHTAILARALRVPTVVGVQRLMREVGAESPVVVDGFEGVLHVNADEAELHRALARDAKHTVFVRELIARKDAPTVTRDGRTVVVRANLELASEAREALARGARGVGLCRTEFLFLQRSSPPSEDEQHLAYAAVVRELRARAEPVTFRTFDFGGDKLPGVSSVSGEPQRERVGANPALGLRALRLSLRRPSLLRAQLRAMLRASSEGPVRILLPLVTGVSEVLAVRAHLKGCAEDLGLESSAVQMGAMIEAPSAALLVDRIGPHVDFLAIGTNDLVQYTLAVDRGDPDVAHLASPLDPSVLRLLKTVVATAGDTPLVCCGDMAADPAGLAALLGLGIHEVSVSVASVPLVQEIIRRVHTEELTQIVTEACECDAASENRTRFNAYLRGVGVDWLGAV